MKITDVNGRRKSRKNLIFLNFKFLIYAILIGICAYIGFHFLNLSAELEDISKISYINYCQLPMSALFDVIILNSKYSIIEILGISIIVLTLLYTSFYMK